MQRLQRVRRNGSFWGKGGGGRRSLKEKGTFFPGETLSNQSSRESWDEEVLVLLSSLPSSPGTGRGLQSKKVKEKKQPFDSLGRGWKSYLGLVR